MDAKPFFRGANRSDLLIALELETSADWGGTEEIEAVAEILGGGKATQYSFPAEVIPGVSVLVTQDYVFVLTGSTGNVLHWEGNLLGSPAISDPHYAGKVHQYFAFVAQSQFDEVRAQVEEEIAGKSLIVVGFSLGGASATLISSLFETELSIHGACFAFATPRVGNQDFWDGYNQTDHVAIINQFDPVGSLPPKLWSALGIFSGVVPQNPFVIYADAPTGWVLSEEGLLRPGWIDFAPVDVLISLGSGDAILHHNQFRYASLLRSLLPDVIPPGFGEVANAPAIDSQQTSAFHSFGQFWDWPKEMPVSPNFLSLGGTSDMGSQIGIFIRDTGRQKGFEEVYYSNNTPPQTLRASLLAAGVYASRAAFLSGDCEIYGMRVSNVGNPRRSALDKPRRPIVGKQTKGKNGNQGMATIEDAIIYLASDGDGRYKRQVHLRGIDAINLEDDIPTGQFRSAALGTSDQIDSFFSLMRTTGGWSVHTNKADNPAEIEIVGAVQATQNSNIILQTAAAHPFEPGDLIDVLGTRAIPILRGRYIVGAVPDATHLTLLGSYRYSPPSQPGGRVRAVLNNFISITEWALLGGGEKKTGKPPFGPRGRRPVILRRR